MPYFNNIYSDLTQKSDKRSKGINKAVFSEYANLPGILDERFFSIFDENKDEHFDNKEFIRAMFKIYCSKLESKIKLVFDICDFDSDGIISKEDTQLILSCVPIHHMNKTLGQTEVST